MPYGFQIWHSASGSIQGPFTQHVVYEWVANGHGTEAGSRGVAEWDCHINDPCFVSVSLIYFLCVCVRSNWKLSLSSVLVSGTKSSILVSESIFCTGL